ISQYAYWLSTLPDPFGGASIGDLNAGVPAVVESPNATIVISAATAPIIREPGSRNPGTHPWPSRFDVLAKHDRDAVDVAHGEFPDAIRLVGRSHRHDRTAADDFLVV